LKTPLKYIFTLATIVVVITLVWGSSVHFHGFKAQPLHIAPPDSSNDTSHVELPYPFNTDPPYPFTGPNDDTSGMYLHNPKNVINDVEYDPETNQYIFSSKIGNYDLSPANTMTFDDYQDYEMDNLFKSYWRNRSSTSSIEKQQALIPKIRLGESLGNIFGSNTIDIRPQGSAELIFGLNSMRRDDPALDAKQQKTTNFDFQEKIQMNVTAKIGDKIELGANYNTEATFEFENKMKLAYEGKEDEIIKKIEAGDVTLPLNSTLITGCQSLFGIKTQLQFGKATVTGVFSQQKSKASTITVSGGAQTSTFNFKADQYEENKHFFVGQYYRNNYNKAMAKLPLISSSMNITKMEVWITTIGAATTENRNICALQDLGERVPYSPIISPLPVFGHDPNLPMNMTNSEYNLVKNNVRNINTADNYLQGISLTEGKDFEVVENARKLAATEYTFNSKLGFISINTSLNPDQVLAVAYQYTVIGDTTVYQVGEFSNGGISAPQTLIVKLLKSTSLNTKIPLWNLMMKNVYAIGAYQVNSQDFRLNVLYTGDDNGIPTGYITEGLINGVPLIRALGCDRLNTQLDPVPDGVFDFIDNAATQGGTIQATNGRIFFPVKEPFGSDLRHAITGGSTDPVLNSIADKYVYDSLYTMTKTGAQQYPEKNKFSLEGVYKSASGSEISLNAMNVPQGSVKVTAGGITLTENVDYTVDYTLGRVKIINEGILNSGTPISISLESQAMFNIQSKTLMGAHVDYKINKDFNLGATILNLTERPITQKVSFGDEPISNTIWGMDGAYQTESRLITKVLDKLPFYATKVPSKVTFSGEFANLIPGHSHAIGKTGTSYIDDFEGSRSAIDIKNVGSWFLASTPEGKTNIGDFPEGAPNTGLVYGYNRAKLCWYVIDPLFLRNNNLTPQHIVDDPNQQSNYFVHEVLEQEVFPNKEPVNGQATNIAVFDLAYYPSEKGPYNYDVLPKADTSAGIAADGTLNNPATRWGGIMRKIETTDFEATNVEYIEFWMMDPFVYDPTHTGGELYFDLGDISEDVLRDGRKSFENGLPTTAVVTGVDTTIWGRVPNIQAITNSFDNNPDARKFQDVGYDGLMDADEQSFFQNNYINVIATAPGLGTGSVAYANALLDPSTDDYHFFRGPDYDAASTSILDRYKKYNGVDGNSPIMGSISGVDYPASSTTIPNSEDINRDNTLSKSERYFEYKIELKPDKMNIGENYITDKYYSQNIPLKNGTTGNVNWYQFKIPIQKPDKIVGDIQDFKSIRFMRMYFKGFSEPIICRFATLDLVRSEWRKYLYSLLAPGEYIPTDDVNQTTFEISAVNIEEDGKRYPVPYILPPGIEREINLGSTNLQKLNEQSLVLKVCNLLDGDARAAYKTAELDVRQYKHIKMFVHEEDMNASQRLKSGDLTIFIRLGTDFTNNYYEYEIPMTPTPWGTSAEDANTIWPDANAFDIALSVFQNAKLARNTEMRTPGSTVTQTTPYVTYDGNNKITVVGMPNLADVRTIMIGIRNPKKTTVSSTDDGLAKCAEVWIDELRLTDFDEKGGWAATAHMNVALADLGTLIVAGNTSTPGFGSIDKKVNERQKENINSYDLATNLELGKFFPEKAGLKIPMHFDYSQSVSNPQYNPLDPDILLKDDLATYQTKAERDSIKKLVQDYTQRKSINFMNMKKEKTGKSKKNHIYDISNFDFTYAYTELVSRNVDVEYDLKKTYMGAIGYNFSNNPKNVTPFGKSKFLNKHKSLRLIKDFNFYYMPKLLSFRTDINRLYSEDLLRDKSAAIVIIEPTFVKDFKWNRLYDLKYDITQSLKFEFSATNNARVDEPEGIIDKRDSDYKNKRDTILQNLGKLGRNTMYNHTFALNYTLPINKIPLFNWITTTARYGGEYTWTAAPLSLDSLGNTIENGNTKQLNFTANMISLYNKIGYLKKLNQENQQQGKTQNQGKQVKPKDTKNTNNSKPPVKKKKKKKSNSKNSHNKNKKAETDSTGTDSTQVDIAKAILDGTLRFLMGVKNININYSEGNGTLLPGFMPTPVALGQDWNLMAPGTGFIFGSQKDIRYTAKDHGWLSQDTLMNTPFETKTNQNLTGRATIEPFTGFKVEVTANRNYTKNHSEFFKVAHAGEDFEPFNASDMGTFSISYFTWNTAFAKDDKTSHSNQNFENFREYRKQISLRLAELNPNSSKQLTDSLYDGYGPTSQEVMISAFLAAYTGKNPNKMSLNTFPKIPMPNWRITYDGLTKINFIKKYLKTATLSHAYRSSYNVGNYTSNILFRDNDGDGYTDARDMIGNFIPKYEVNMVSITEQFAPLFGIDMTWNNSLLSKFEYKRSRDLSLSLANNQLTEITSKEIVLGLGYRIKNVRFSIKGITGGKKKSLKSDVNIKADLSIRDNKTVLRKLVEDVNQVSAGQQIISINASIDYQINEKFVIKLFFDKIITNPFVSSQFPNSNTNAGISLRFTLAQ